MSHRLIPPPKGAPHESGVFQDWYTRIYQTLVELSHGVDGLSAESFGAPRISAYPAFGIRAGTGIAVTQDALGFTIASSGPSDMTENRVFSVHSPKPMLDYIKAGTNISLSQDALGYTITASGYAPDSDQNIIAQRVFGA